jgi:hypothetical protein
MKHPVVFNFSNDLSRFNLKFITRSIVMPYSEQNLGRVKSGQTPGKTYEVKWDPNDKRVYVRIAGWTYVGKASSAGDAMRKAEAYVFDK